MQHSILIFQSASQRASHTCFRLLYTKHFESTLAYKMAVDTVMEGRDSSLFVQGSSSGLSYQLHPVSDDLIKKTKIDTSILLSVLSFSSCRWLMFFLTSRMPCSWC